MLATNPVRRTRIWVHPLVKRRVGGTWNRLLVPEGLVRTRFVVVADVLGDDAPEVILTEDEDVVEHLSP